jgi:hypothetical protein
MNGTILPKYAGRFELEESLAGISEQKIAEPSGIQKTCFFQIHRLRHAIIAPSAGSFHGNGGCQAA